MKGGRSRAKRQDVELTFEEMVPALNWVAELVAAVGIRGRPGAPPPLAPARWTWAPLVAGGVAGAVAWLAGVDPLPVPIAFFTASTSAGAERPQVGGRGREAGNEGSGNARGSGRFNWLCRSVIAVRRKERRVRGGRLAIGVSNARRVCEVPFGEDRGCHGLILGATDSGKTVSAAAIAQATIRGGNAVIAMDPKGDPDLERLLETEAARAPAFRSGAGPRAAHAYNVAKRGGPSEVADKVLSGTSGPSLITSLWRCASFSARSRFSERAGSTSAWRLVAQYMEAERLERLAARTDEAIAERVEHLSAGPASKDARRPRGGEESRCASRGVGFRGVAWV